MANQERQTPPFQKLPWEEALTKEKLDEIIRWREDLQLEPGPHLLTDPLGQRGLMVVYHVGEGLCQMWFGLGGEDLEETMRTAQEFYEAMESRKVEEARQAIRKNQKCARLKL